MIQLLKWNKAISTVSSDILTVTWQTLFGVLNACLNATFYIIAATLSCSAVGHLCLPLGLHFWLSFHFHIHAQQWELLKLWNEPQKVCLKKKKLPRPRYVFPILWSPRKVCRWKYVNKSCLGEAACDSWPKFFFFLAQSFPNKNGITFYFIPGYYWNALNWEKKKSFGHEQRIGSQKYTNQLMDVHDHVVAWSSFAKLILNLICMHCTTSPLPNKKEQR